MTALVVYDYDVSTGSPNVPLVSGRSPSFVVARIFLECYIELETQNET